MYQALYRKYRPKTLDEVCGQETIIKIIKNSILKGQINHAYLFSGPRGTGKTSVAKIFAKIVNCESPNEYIPCEKCPSCTEKTNSDIIEIDAASNNGVDEIRELRNKVNLVPTYGKYKIYIVDEVHMLTTGAFNALLKTLEEPPAHIIFILATTDPQKIPETILSRCQRFDFKKINNNNIVENLKKISEKEKINITEEALYEIARISDGGMRDSIGLLDQARLYTDKQITIEDIHDINGTLTEEDLKELLDNLKSRNLEKILEKTDEYNEKGKNFIKLIEELINFTRNIILFKKVPKYIKEKNINIENLEKISKKIKDNELFDYIEIFNKYSFEMKNTNNTKLMFELAFIQIISNSEKNSEQLEISKKNEEYPTTMKEKNVECPVSTKNETNIEVSENKKEKNITKEEKEQLEKIKNIRINNTLAKFNKKITIEIRNKLNEKLNELILDPEFSHAASILLDGELKAASEKNIIFVYKTSRISSLFNENLINIENTIEKIMNQKYDIISTDEEQWNIIKDEFNNKKRKFIFKEENINIENLLKKDKGDIISMFEDIIEYN